MTMFIDPHAKLFQHMDKLAVLQQGGMTRAPVNVEIDLSNRCSLGCEWCHFAYTHTRGPLKGKRAKPADARPGGDLMTYDLAKRVVDELILAGVESITWTGGGEPTLHPQFDVITQYADYRGIKQGLYTHGGHIGDDRARRLSHYMTFVYVSLDAADAATYKACKGVDRFEAALTGIRNLTAAQGPATIGIGYLLTEQTWRDWPRMIALAKSLQADYCQFRPTILYDEHDPSSKADVTGWMRQARAELESVKDTPGVIVDMDRLQMYEEWTGHGYETCYWTALQTVITPNGKMWRCVNKREHGSAELGDLSTESFRDIWARHKPCKVDGACRVMCRGHLPNLTLNKTFTPIAHREFI